jgi:hypothetical protein
MSRAARSRATQPKTPRAPARECILCCNRCTNARARRLDTPIGNSEELIRSYFEYFSVIPESLIVDSNAICPACYKLVVNSSNLYKVFAESVEVLEIRNRNLLELEPPQIRDVNLHFLVVACSRLSTVDYRCEHGRVLVSASVM